MFVEEGISCLWKGHNAGQILTITYSTVQFSTYEELHDVGKKLLPSDWPYSEHVLNVFCGGVAGFTATVVSFPFDVIRTHLVFQGNLKVR